ncbi:hypothetical protein PCA10_01070 [Metapseudomonas resinovorans NBRC 106553]|uniref:Uncharacterized protein n=1 Tax=Metapseudomonas resinovorans NBRC 106553 TaxID=1245471 RepID=S6B9S7_METRE|nr:hypothetical protein PCA10_01070 [Pseudomonas resinovorans NBRC 106553]
MATRVWAWAAPATRDRAMAATDNERRMKALRRKYLRDLTAIAFSSSKPEAQGAKVSGMGRRGPGGNGGLARRAACCTRPGSEIRG